MFEKPTISSLELTGDNFAKRWIIFRDSQEFKFLRALLSRRIDLHRQCMENTKNAQEVAEFQGKIAELKTVLNFLSLPNIQSDIIALKETLKSYGY